VHVLGDRIVPRAISGRFTLVCAILRQLALVFSLVFSILLHRVGLTFAPSTALDEPHRWPLTTSTAPFDVLFVDQLSVGIPLLRWLTNTRVVFYCHFPDLLMNPDRTGPTSILRSLYRWPLDWLEEVTTGA
jgi:alpha-1,3/alpha-1,6-mannosyltransferase